MPKFYPKTKEEIMIMAEGGRILAGVKAALWERIQTGVSALDLEELADRLIVKAGAEASFKKVSGYHWALCVNVNAGVVHGIPTQKVVFREGDLVSVDLGVFYKGFHTDSAFSKEVGRKLKLDLFLNAGRKALTKAVAAAQIGKKVSDLSRAIEETIVSAGYAPIRALVGHVVGRALHEDPQIPCFVPPSGGEDLVLAEGATLAIEVMYALG